MAGMPRLLDYLGPVYAFLASIDPSLPRALFVALVFLSVMLWRKVSPNSWRKWSNLIPVTEADTSWLKVAAQKLLQALPSAVLGAVYGALGTGGDLWPTVKLAAMGLIAPFLHEVAWRYEGKLGDGKKLGPPSLGASGGTGSAPRDYTDVGSPPYRMTALSRRRRQRYLLPSLGVALLLITGCSLLTPKNIKTVADIASDLCHLHYAEEKPQLSFDDIARTYCQDLDPWKDVIPGAKRLGAAKAAALHPETSK